MTKTKNGNGNGHARPEKPKRDNAVDEIREAMQGMDNASIYHGTYLSRGTIAKLLEARRGRPRTRYPSFMTLKGVASTRGLEYRLVEKEGK